MTAWRRLLPLLALGCAHVDRDAGAPGFVDLTRPPEALAIRGVEPAAPPGERLFCVTPGMVALFLPPGPESRPYRRANLGGEVSLEWGQAAPRGHVPRPGPWIGAYLPDRAWGVTLGAQAFMAAWDEPARGPLTLEVRRRAFELISFGGGALYEPGLGQPGAVASALVGPLMARAAYVRGEGASLYLGFDLWFPISWVWTR